MWLYFIVFCCWLFLFSVLFPCSGCYFFVVVLNAFISSFFFTLFFLLLFGFLFALHFFSHSRHYDTHPTYDSM